MTWTLYIPGTANTLTMDLTTELPRSPCSIGQFACSAFGCVEAADVCDGREDCIDGSDEHLCGELSKADLIGRYKIAVLGCYAARFIITWPPISRIIIIHIIKVILRDVQTKGS